MSRPALNNKKASSVLVALFIVLFLLWIPSLQQTSLFITLLQDGETALTSSRSYKATGRYAYAFVIGGCRPEENAYRGFLYDVWISAHIFNQVKSQADVVVFIQMSSQSLYNRLPEQEESVTAALGINLIYLDKNLHDNFYEITLDKFRVVNMTGYDRVMYLDSDAMPLGNLDYIFELSMQGVLQENVVLAGKNEPANGGFFMVTSRAGDWKKLQAIVFRKEIKSAHINNTEKFDLVQGWGHTILPPDYWKSTKDDTLHTNWTFHAAYGMQGLLWYWVKYFKRNVSVRIGNLIENWGTDPGSGKVRIVSTRSNLLDKYARPIVHDEMSCEYWMCDLAHFASDKKPWQHRPPRNLKRMTKPTDAFELWFHTLLLLDRQYLLGIDFQHWDNTARPPLGTWPLPIHVGSKAIRSVDRIWQAQNKPFNGTVV